jgi:hypothetical protein
MFAVRITNVQLCGLWLATPRQYIARLTSMTVRGLDSLWWQICLLCAVLILGFFSGEIGRDSKLTATHRIFVADRSEETIPALSTLPHVFMLLT